MSVSPSTRTLARRAMRAVLLAASFLAAGAVVSVGVAWFCVWRVRLVLTQEPGWDSMTSSAYRPAKREAPFGDILAYVPPDWMNNDGLAPYFIGGGQHELRGPGRSVSVLHHAFMDVYSYSASSKPIVLSAERIVRLDQAGWPLPAVAAHAIRSDTDWTPSAMNWYGAVVLPVSLCADDRQRVELIGSGPTPLPLRPQPIGLAVDSAFYATMLWVPVLMARQARHGIRRLRNLCPSCGYSREGLGMDRACPECGRAQA